ncbi:hypothetical protein [Planctellipticum variicoloris]|uniref:hypothetical protein n=1 Tax=Planctellipticum variicoloris TaxID=3064265 RepID=UPI0030133F28|nr:hypothetical protein SH412_000545 [Planctomycetaceae bacterium SH412]
MTKPKNVRPTTEPQTEKKPIGRPPGSPNVRETAVAVPSRCNACGSTEREPYLDRNDLEFAGVDSGGKAFTHIVRRRVRCAGCGQMRIDVTRENRVPPSR